MNKPEYETTETFSEKYIVYGFDDKGKKVFVTANGYNPYEWKHEGYYSDNAVRFNELSWAQHEADHAPSHLQNLTIEKVSVYKIIQTKIKREIIEYTPKGLPELIPF